MTRISQTALSLVAVLALPAAAAAAGGAVTLGFDVHKPVPVGDLDDAFEGDLAYHGYGTFKLVGALAARGEVGRDRFDLADDGPELEFTHYAGGLQYGGFGESGALGLENARLLPYLFGVVGRYRTDSDLAGFDDESNLGFAVGAGLNIRLGEHFGLQGDVHFHNVRFDDVEDEEWERWFAPGGGVYLSF